MLVSSRNRNDIEAIKDACSQPWNINSVNRLSEWYFVRYSGIYGYNQNSKSPKFSPHDVLSSDDASKSTVKEHSDRSHNPVAIHFAQWRQIRKFGNSIVTSLQILHFIENHRCDN